jgi:hypothetical protein
MVNDMSVEAYTCQLPEPPPLPPEGCIPRSLTRWILGERADCCPFAILRELIVERGTGNAAERM